MWTGFSRLVACLVLTLMVSVVPATADEAAVGEADVPRVALNVREARIGQVKVEGNTFYSTAFILRQFAPALEGGIVRRDLLERQLRLMNEFTDLNVKAVLQSAPDGATDILLEVKDAHAFHGLV